MRITLIFTIYLFGILPGLSSQKLVEVGKGYAATSVNTTVFRNNSLTTHGGNQYIAYYDGDGYMILGKRELGSAEWELKNTGYQGNVKDAHNSISLMADGDGFLHVAFDHHGHPLNYCKSVASGSLELEEKQPMTGIDESHVTYPEFYRLPDGDLLFVYRSGSSGRGNMVMNHYSVADKTWSMVQNILIDGENQRNAYWQLCVDEQGIIHVSWVWRETWMVETNHDLCYARSADKGVTWQKSSGEVYDLPITAGNAEYACIIPQNSELINQTSMVADASGNPYIATYWRDADSDIPQYRLVWHDGDAWQQQQVGNRTTPFTLAGGGTKNIPIARPRMLMNDGEVYYFLRDEERGSKVTLAYSPDINKGEWMLKDLTDFPVDAWEPSYDIDLWKQQREVHLFVQHTRQGDGETTENHEPQMVYVLEMNINN